MNLLETLVYNLPEPVQSKALDAGSKSDDCCTVNCASIEVIEDYISELQAENAELSQRIYEHNCRAIGAPIRKDT
tara:strand:- start:469 stop:693 length:225 start_codon:yes stop_codon:yes gene_type:complete